MRKEILSVTFIIVCFTCIFISDMCIAQGKNSFNIGAGLVSGAGSGSIGKMEYEGVLKSSRISLLGRLNIGKWDWDDVDGELFALEGGIHFYPNSQEKIEGFFIGGTLGYWKNTWEYVNYYDDPRRSADSSGISSGLEIGYRFDLESKKISFIPSFQLLGQFNQGNKDIYSEESLEADSLNDTVRVHTIFSLAVGISF